MGVVVPFLLGDGPLRAFMQVCEVWEEAHSAGARPGFRVVVVRGSPGSGRTLLLQNLYRHFVAAEYDPPYWPATFDLTDGWVAPEVVAPPEGARLTRMWVGVPRSTPASSGVIRLSAQVDGHLNRIAEAMARANALTVTRIQALLEETLFIGMWASVFVPALTLPVNILTSQAVAGGLTRGLRSAMDTRKGIVEDALSSSGLTIDIARRSKAVDAARTTGRVLAEVSSLVPCTIVVDDADQADDLTLLLLHALVRRESAHGVLVLVTGQDCDPPVDPVGQWVEEDILAGRAREVHLPRLTTAEMIEVAHAHLAGVGVEVSALNADGLTQVLSAADGVPGRLVELLDAAAVRTGLTTGTALPDLDAINTDDVWAQRFALLPEQARVGLAAAAVCGRATLHGWLITDPDTTPAVDGATDEAVKAATHTGWVSRSRNDVLRFSDRAYRVVRAQVGQVLAPAQICTIRDRLTAHLLYHQRNGWAGVPPDVALAGLDALTRYGTEGTRAFIADVDLTPVPLLVSWLRLHRATGRAHLEERTLAQLQDRVTSGPPLGLSLVVATADALLDAGHLQHTLDVLEVDYDRAVVRYGQGSPQTFPALDNLASAYTHLARVRSGHPGARPLFEHAISLTTALLKGREKHYRPGAPHTRVTATRWRLAELYAETYRYRDSLEHGATVVTEESRENGADHPDTLTTRGNLASWRGEGGDVAGAVRDFEALLPDRARVLGADHPHTLTTRSNLASWRGEGGDVAGAVRDFEALLPDMARVLGADHPATLTTRSYLASCRGEGGDVAGAVRDFEALLPDMARVLGADHPATLTTRNNLARWRGEGGNVAGAALE
jgi:hypothetical protein